MADKTTRRLLTAGRVNGEGNILKGGRRQNASGVLLAVALTRVASEAGRRSQQRRQLTFPNSENSLMLRRQFH
jgi:hypothetical protein